MVKFKFFLFLKMIRHKTKDLDFAQQWQSSRYFARDLSVQSLLMAGHFLTNNSRVLARKRKGSWKKKSLKHTELGTWKLSAILPMRYLSHVWDASVNVWNGTGTNKRRLRFLGEHSISSFSKATSFIRDPRISRLIYQEYC